MTKPVLCWVQWDRDGKIIGRRYSVPDAPEPAPVAPQTARGIIMEGPRAGARQSSLL